MRVFLFVRCLTMVKQTTQLIFRTNNAFMSAKLIDTRICIIGAGPAGATTSLFLSQQKIPHTIVDAAVFPRDKVCGDALDLKVLRVLHQLDPQIINEVFADKNFTKSWGASIILSKDKKNNFGLPPGNHLPFFMVAKRAYFDNFLVSKINTQYATFLQGTKVKKLERVNDKWIVPAEDATGGTTLHADLIVGADGDHSTLLRSLGERKIDRRNYAGALRQYWKGISELDENNRLEIYLPKKLPLAYLWIFPLGNGEANVGCGLASDLIKEKNIDLKKLFNELIVDDPALSHRFKNATPLEKPVGWGLPFASQRRTVYGDGYLLVGDAASLVCPTTGEGVGPGMMSGFIASQFLKRAVAQNNFSEKMFTNYDREIYKRLQDDVWKYRMLRRLSPMLYNYGIKFLSGLGVTRYYFNKNVSKWTKTATTPIEVNM